MADFAELTAREALELSLRGADHLGVKHAAGVAAARLLADRVDELAEYGWVIDGKLDNVTVPTFVRALESLGLTVPRAPPARAKAESAAPAAPEAASPGATIVQMQQRVAGRRGH